MNRILRMLLLAVMIFPLAGLQAQGLFNIKGVQANAEVSQFQQNTKKFILKEKVRISTGAGLITCDYAEINTETFDFEAKGNVVASGLEAGDKLKSDKVYGNLKTKIIGPKIGFKLQKLRKNITSKNGLH